MKNSVLVIIGLVAILLGVVWVLQGSGVLGGSFMSGSPTWLVIGAVVLVAGLLLILLAARGRRKV